jgi:hypothetical protein
MEKVIDWLFPRKRDLMYETAMESTKALASLFKLYREGDLSINIQDHAFIKIYPHDEKSPAIYWIDDHQYLIRYPENSTPYNHKFQDKCKFIECISGRIYDKNSDTKLFRGDRIKVTPKDNFIPYTMDEPCYLRVCIGNCESVFDQVCK